MRKSRFTEEQIIGVSAGAGGRRQDGGCVPQARDQPGDVLPVEGEVRRLGGFRGASAAHVGSGEQAAVASAGGRDVGQRGVERRRVKKMVTSAARRSAVVAAREAHGISERRTCMILGADRSVARYRSRRPDDAVARLRMRALAAERRRFGYRRLGLLLAREGVQLNHKKLRGLYREEWLQVRRRGGRKRALGTRAPMALPDGPNRRCSLDFVSGHVIGRPSVPGALRGRRLHPRVPGSGGGHVAVGAACGTRAGRDRGGAWFAGGGGERQRNEADQQRHPVLVARSRRRLALHRTGRSCPRFRRRSRWNGNGGKSTQNAFVESFNGRLRDESLNERVFTSLRHARVVLAACRQDYHGVRPHSALGGRAPGSISLPPCSPASSPLRAGFAGGLRPGLTQAARDSAGTCGRDGETALDRTEKYRHDGRDGNPGPYF